MKVISFKERVKKDIIDGAKIYKEKFIDYDYILCLENKNFYIINAKEDNYKHLTGVNSLLKPKDFYAKCLNGTLQEEDFNFIKEGRTEKSVKGSVRRKISALLNINNIFENETLVEENFTKNQVKCSFATTNKKCTLGFIGINKSRPMSLLFGNELDNNKTKNIDLLMRKQCSKEKYNKIIIGDLETLGKHIECLKDYLDDSILNDLQKHKASKEIQSGEQEAAATSEE